MNYEKIYYTGIVKLDKFRDFSDWIVKNRITNVKDGDDIEALSTFVSAGLAVGAEIRRPKDILTGIGIGVLGTGLAWGVSKFVNKKKDEKDKVVIKDLNEWINE